MHLDVVVGLPWWLSGKESICQCKKRRIPRFGPGLAWEDSPAEGNGNTLQYSCLGNRIDREAWWATVHGVARIGHDLATKQQFTLFRYQTKFSLRMEEGRRGLLLGIVLHCLAPSVMVIVGVWYSKWSFREKICVPNKLL